MRKGRKKPGPPSIPRNLPTSKPSSSETIKMAAKPAHGRSSKKSGDDKSEKSCKDKSGKRNESKPNTSTQQKVIGSVRLMPKPKSKDKGKHTITIKDFAKHSTQKDQGNKRQRYYMFQRWKKRSDKKSRHFSHFKIDTSKNKLLDHQSIPGHCILCPKQFYMNVKGNMIRHFHRVHIKRQLKICHTRILFCKCCEVALTSHLEIATTTVFVVTNHVTIGGS